MEGSRKEEKRKSSIRKERGGPDLGAYRGAGKKRTVTLPKSRAGNGYKEERGNRPAKTRERRIPDFCLDVFPEKRVTFVNRSGGNSLIPAG